MKSRRINRFIVAGSIALATPLFALAQPGPGGPMPGAGPGAGGRPDAAQMPGPQHGMHGQAGQWGHGRMHQGAHGPMQRGMHGATHFRGEGPGMGWLRGLNLTEQQRDKVFEIMHGSAPALREQGKVLQQTRRELARLPLSADYDQAKARGLAERHAQAMAQMAELRARNMNEIYRQLTPEQQKHVSERMARFEQRGQRSMRDGARPGAPREQRPGAPARG
ncbi:MAG: Spy/CpxP family protein refolding chaperone [Burkholderiales bacterium]|nr:Spy/CpxP family protein refolding chaperone [Burkholderiales bacterium]ODU66368.1 MAG: hypothetical protein ABT05_05510 [Lautropia sp. SCN 66-9]